MLKNKNECKMNESAKRLHRSHALSKTYPSFSPPKKEGVDRRDRAVLQRLAISLSCAPRGHHKEGEDSGTEEQKSRSIQVVFLSRLPPLLQLLSFHSSPLTASAGGSCPKPYKLGLWQDRKLPPSLLSFRLAALRNGDLSLAPSCCMFPQGKSLLKRIQPSPPTQSHLWNSHPRRCLVPEASVWWDIPHGSSRNRNDGSTGMGSLMNRFDFKNPSLI